MPFGAPGADALTIALPDSGNVLIGQQFDFQIAFKNTGTDTGYGPYIDLYLPSGADGDDGVTIAANGAITYLGQAVNYQIITLNAEGKADHPYARTTTGAAVEISGVANQTVVVIELPFGSYTNQQPAAELTVHATLHKHADLGTPLDITAVSGFRYGKTAVEDYGSDPSYTLDSPTTVQITPVLVNYDHVFNGPEHETATGPNFPRSITTTIDVADGQTLRDYVLTLGVPSNAIVTDVTGGTAVDGDILKRHFDTLTGSTTVTLTYYIPETLSGQGGTPTVLDPVTGAPSETSFHVSGQGQWTPLDTRDRAPVTTGNPTGAIIDRRRHRQGRHHPRQ